MNRLAFALSITVAFGFGFIACEDDTNDAPRTDAGVEAGTAAMCKGTFASINRTQLGMSGRTGMCTTSADLDVICANDVGGTSRTCGTGCFSQLGAGASNEALATCT